MQIYKLQPSKHPHYISNRPFLRPYIHIIISHPSIHPPSLLHFIQNSTYPCSHTFIQGTIPSPTYTINNSSPSPCTQISLQFHNINHPLTPCHNLPCQSHNFCSSSHSSVLKSATLSISLSSQLFIHSNHLSI